MADPAPETKKIILTKTEADGTKSTTEVTEEQFKAMAIAALSSESVFVDASETRQIRQYEGNTYKVGLGFKTGGASEILKSVDPSNSQEGKTLAATAMQQALLAKVNGAFSFIKARIHEQQVLDGIPNVDRRQDEIKK
jgi:hypothetical protein